MNILVNVINAFSINGTGGNPAGVVFDADELSDQQKQQIARAAGFSETAFVSRSAIADFKLDFFTPQKQIPHCGHATIATFSYLKKLGQISGEFSSKETIDGIRQIKFKNNFAYMEQKAPVVTIVDKKEILPALNIEDTALNGHIGPAIVNTGNSFMIVPIRDEQTLATINHDRELVSAISAKYGLIGFYLYVAEGDELGYDATTRMFAPYYGIDEEAGTGMAAGPLACHLYTAEQVMKKCFRIRQGDFMTPSSGSIIYAELQLSHSGEITGLYAGGAANLSGQKYVDI